MLLNNSYEFKKCRIKIFAPVTAGVFLCMKNNYLNVDLDLFRQPKVQRLESELGDKASIFYIELKLVLAGAVNYKLLRDYKMIAILSNVEVEFVRSVIEDFDLFVLGNDYFWCEDVVKKMSEINN